MLMHETPECDATDRDKSHPPNVRIGSQAVIPNFDQNVRSWVTSGPQFNVTGGLLVAEGVEQVGIGGDFAIRHWL